MDWADPPGAELISSRRNPLVQRLRRLHQGRGRREQGLVLLEGTHLLQEVVRLGLVPELLLATPSWLASHDALVAALPAATRRQAATEAVLAAAASTEHPDGVLATLPLAALPAAASGELARGGGADFVLALERIQDPGNLGTLLRTALAAGVQQVWLAEGADPFQPKVLRASAGAALALPLLRLSLIELEKRLRQAGEAGLQRLAAVLPAPDRPALPYWQLDWCRPTLLLLGNEGAGLAPDLVALADVCVTVPHSPALESLNVAVAAAPLLLERWRQSLQA